MSDHKATQAEMVLDYIEEFGSITPLDAIRDIGVYRLSARVSDLRKKGYPIETKIVSVPNRFGGKSNVARYSLAVSCDG